MKGTCIRLRELRFLYWDGSVSFAREASSIDRQSWWLSSCRLTHWQVGTSTPINYSGMPAHFHIAIIVCAGVSGVSVSRGLFIYSYSHKQHILDCISPYIKILGLNVSSPIYSYPLRLIVRVVRSEPKGPNYISRSLWAGWQCVWSSKHITHNKQYLINK